VKLIIIGNIVIIIFSRGGRFGSIGPIGYTLCLQKTAPLRQVGIHSVIFQTQKIRNIRFVGNFILKKYVSFNMMTSL